jgi:hypothetical protein
LFNRSDFPDENPSEWHKFVTVRLEDGEVVPGELPIDYYGDLVEEYSYHNTGYIAGGAP